LERRLLLGKSCGTGRSFRGAKGDYQFLVIVSCKFNSTRATWVQAANC
jgi:hypothetical protein